LLKKKLRNAERVAARRRVRLKMYMTDLSYGGIAFALVITMIMLMAWVSYERRQRWPELEPAILKQKQKQRQQQHLLWLQANQEQQQKQDQEFIATQQEKNNN
jgi:hypothetical protein